MGGLNIAPRGGGGGGGAWTPTEGGGEGRGGVGEMASVPGPWFCVRADVGPKGAGTQILAPKKSVPTKPPPPPPPHICVVKMISATWGSFLSRRCWAPPPPPSSGHGRWSGPAPHLTWRSCDTHCPKCPARHRGAPPQIQGRSWDKEVGGGGLRCPRVRPLETTQNPLVQRDRKTLVGHGQAAQGLSR